MDEKQADDRSGMGAENFKGDESAGTILERVERQRGFHQGMLRMPSMPTFRDICHVTTRCQDICQAK